MGCAALSGTCEIGGPEAETQDGQEHGAHADHLIGGNRLAKSGSGEEGGDGGKRGEDCGLGTAYLLQSRIPEQEAANCRHERVICDGGKGRCACCPRQRKLRKCKRDGDRAAEPRHQRRQGQRRNLGVEALAEEDEQTFADDGAEDQSSAGERMRAGRLGPKDDRENARSGEESGHEHGALRPFAKDDDGNGGRDHGKRADYDTGIGRGRELQTGNEQGRIADAAGARLQEEDQPIALRQPRPRGCGCAHQPKEKRECDREAQRRCRKWRQAGGYDLARDNGAADEHHGERQLNISLKSFRHPAAIPIDDGGR